jgi:hypothetical protein
MLVHRRDVVLKVRYEAFDRIFIAFFAWPDIDRFVFHRDSIAHGCGADEYADVLSGQNQGVKTSARMFPHFSMATKQEVRSKHLAAEQQAKEAMVKLRRAKELEKQAAEAEMHLKQEEARKAQEELRKQQRELEHVRNAT